MKKGQGLPLNTIVIALIVIIVAVILIFVFRTYIGKEAEFIGLQLKGFEDCDCDGTPDFLDDCDFDPNVQKQEVTETVDTATGKKTSTKMPCEVKGNDEKECIRITKHGGKCPR